VTGLPPPDGATGRGVHRLDVRSLMFVPGGRPDMIAKVGRAGPDAAVLDLEDAVGVDSKDSARALAVEAIAALEVPASTVVMVRVNPVGSAWFADDLAAATGSAADGIVLPKVSRPVDLETLQRGLIAHGRPDMLVVAGLETALGVADARSLLAHGGADAAYFGAEDFVADIDGRRTVAGTEVLYARSQVCLACHLDGVGSIDQTVVAVHDDQRFVTECEEALAFGYGGKICIHPHQVELAHRAFSPSDEEIAHARRVVYATADGVGLLDGEMVDAVHVRLAERVLARAARVA
jgi:citrate lyase subunit beta/citryl-CoA lyase